MAESLSLSVRKRRTLTGAWLAIQRNGRLSKSAETRAEIRLFAEDAPLNLERIQRQLSKGLFMFKPAKGVRAKKKGKSGFRPLVLAPLESRIVQRAVHDVLIGVKGIEELVRTPHSFGGVKKHKDDELGAVPAAISAVLDGIGTGGAYVVRSDISKFFTKIPKSAVRKIVASVINDDEFLELFDKAVAAELSNMKELMEDANAFPIEDIGVAQGNSLSPLLGNLLLRDFDASMNATPGIRCIRYIDDFIVLGPNKTATIKAFEKALNLLSQWQMTVASEKTDQGSSQQAFEFLGIEFNNGFLRPSKASRERFLGSVRLLLEEAQQAQIGFKAKSSIEKRLTVLRTLITLTETINGWGMHYRFCNDSFCLRQLDEQVALLLQNYLATYRSVRNSVSASSNWELLGIQALEKIERASFKWPKSGSTKAP